MKSKRRLYRIILLVLVVLLLAGLTAGGLFLASQLRPAWFHEVVVEREVSALLERDGALLLLESYDYQPCEPPCRAGRLWSRQGEREEMLLEDPDLVHARQVQLLGSRLVVLGCPATPSESGCWVAVADLDAKTVKKLRGSDGARGFALHGDEVLWDDGERIARQSLTGGETFTLAEGKGQLAPAWGLIAGDDLLWLDGAGALSRRPLGRGRAQVVAEPGGPPRSLTLLERTVYWTSSSPAGQPEVRALSLDPSAGAPSGARTLLGDACAAGQVRVLAGKLVLECPGDAERHGELIALADDGSPPRSLLKTDAPGSFTQLHALGDRFCWWEAGSETLFAAPLGGGEPVALLRGVVPHALALVGSSVYVSDVSLTRVVRADW